MSAAATIVVHLDGGRERARRCLLALAALDPEPAHEVVVVDDATAGLQELLAGLEGDLQMIRNERRLGLRAAALDAAEVAVGGTLVLLRGAPELAPDALAPLLEALADREIAAAAADLPGGGAHPTASMALALRREDITALRSGGTCPEVELAAVCADLAARGRVETVSTALAAPARSHAVSARAEPGTAAELTIVIPTLDATSDRVRACIAAVQAATEAPHQIVLVDNGSPPQGFTAPVNAGLRAVDSPYAVVMNDDVEPLPGWWPPLRKALDEGAEVAFPHTVEGYMRTDFAAWCFAISRRALELRAHAPGEFFDPSMRVWFQDADLLTRLRAAGNPPLLVRESRIRHGQSETVETQDPQLRAWIERTIGEDRQCFEHKHPDVVVVG